MDIRMIETIARLRQIADDTERLAKADRGRQSRPEMIDLAAKWHWLASEAAKLCKRGRELNGFAFCGDCHENCFRLVDADSSHFVEGLVERQAPGARSPDGQIT